MSIARTRSCVTLAVEGHAIDVEADVSEGLVSMNVTGLADASVNESRDRVRAALVNSGEAWPNKRITVGLSPAWLPKHGSGLDLAIAVAICAAADESINLATQPETMFYAELALDGRVRSINGTLIAAMTARATGCRRLVVAAGDVAQAKLVDEVEVIGVSHLRQALALVRGIDVDDFSSSVDEPESVVVDEPAIDFAQVRGQVGAKRALEVAAAGGHHVAMLGSPGVGKTMLASRLPTILPQLTRQAALEAAAIRSAVGGAGATVMSVTPPFAAPHHTSSYAALIGGGSGLPTIGMVTQAHRGVLFLDEAPEFASNVLDALRQPLESGVVALSRKTFTLNLPARFQLIVAANPCPCGRALDRVPRCQCRPAERRRYLARLSGPLLDRIDVHVIVDPPTVADYADDVMPESSADIRERVVAARERALHRLQGTGWTCNGDVPGTALRELYPLAPAAARLLTATLAGNRTTARGIDRVAKVAWTLADLAGADRPDEPHVVEALGMRDAEGRWPA